ncbi:cytochrome P450 [Segeticoccus rhizosphaerae]|jgi:fatty-acid peroxygenase|uniref:cytochrome P450 n=1 Tax=Segeticoccus rhizosphaerae TaxID=1104777 RepID=UPI0010BFFE90|nr:cytochrome P450 [Ornithinicoccus soli]
MPQDQTLSMLRRGYTFRSSVFGHGDDRDAVVIRFLGQPTLFVTGETGARLFYDDSRLTRVDAAPAAAGNLIFGRGGVQGLEGEAHQARRRLFLDVLDREGVARLTDVVRRRWQEAQYHWVAAGHASLHGAAVEVLGRSALEWAGVDAPDPVRTAHDLAAIIDGFGSIGLRNLRGRLARRRCEQLARDAVATARRTAPATGIRARSPLQAVAHAREADGSLLDLRVAGVELLNLLRPIVAVAWFVDFAAIALAKHPRWRARVSTAGSDADRTAFVHEIRRYYPLAPLLAARAKKEFSFAGSTVQPGQRVLLDIIGINHDPRLWNAPWRFEPERFLRRVPGEYDFVAQGGGPFATGHRCPGEPTTVALLEELARALADLPFHISRAELSFPAHRVPTRPLRGPVLRDLGAAARHPTGVSVETNREPHEEDWTMSSHADLVAAVTAQHGQIAQLISRTAQSEGETRREAFEALRRLMALHEAAEQATIHPLVTASNGEGSEVGQERVEEEDEASNLMERLESFDVTSYEFTIQVQLLEEAVTFHANAEETRELPRLRDAPEADLRRAIGALSTVEQLSSPESEWSPGDRSFGAMVRSAATLFAVATTPADGRNG